MKTTGIVLVAALLTAACATSNATLVESPPPAELPRTIAVLPFSWPEDSEREEAARLLARMIHGALSATTYDVLKPQVVEERLVRAGLADPKALREKPPAEIAQALRVDGLVYGELTRYDRIFLLAYSQVAAGGSLRLVNARSGATVFERKEVVRSHAGGVPTNPLSAAITVAQTAFKMREIELVRACDDLVREILKGLPTPPVGEARRPPALAQVLSDGGGRALRAGETVTVIVQGQPGVVGSFDVVPLAKNIALEESGEGIYTGRWVVKPGENGRDVYVAARLADGAGRTNEREDVLGRFTVDTSPPAAPRGLSVALREGKVQIAWLANSEPDLATYRVYRSESPLSGFAVVATPESPTHVDAGEPIFHYRVTAVDGAGNESEPSAAVSLPVLASPLTGAVARDAYLVAARSPYLIQGSLTVENGATLHILPGVEVRFARNADGIVVKDGGLVARGTAAQPIVFSSASERPAPGDYKSAIHVRTRAGQGVVLERVRVEHGATALRVESGALEVLASEITGNLQTGVEVSETGVLKLAESRIAGQKAGAGVAVRGFGRALLRANRIEDNGWAVTNYSANQVEARGNWWGSAAPPASLFIGDVDHRDPLPAAP